MILAVLSSRTLANAVCENGFQQIKFFAWHIRVLVHDDACDFLLLIFSQYAAFHVIHLESF